MSGQRSKEIQVHDKRKRQGQEQEQEQSERPSAPLAPPPTKQRRRRDALMVPDDRAFDEEMRSDESLRTRSTTYCRSKHDTKETQEFSSSAKQLLSYLSTYHTYVVIFTYYVGMYGMVWYGMVWYGTVPCVLAFASTITNNNKKDKDKKIDYPNMNLSLRSGERNDEKIDISHRSLGDGESSGDMISKAHRRPSLS